MAINFNPNLPPNDSLEPWEIEEKVAARNAETKRLAAKAWETGGVLPSIAKRAADHASNSRQTPEAKKARRDARTWWRAKNSDWDDGDCGE